jgi:hypothetical protein
MGFVFLASDALDQLFRSRAEGVRGQQTDGSASMKLAVRRPYRGIQIKNDTYATISIINGRGEPIKLVSESSVSEELGNGRKGEVDQYADFILQSVSEERVEKSQIVETFGDSFIFLFGERPRLVTFQGVLVNSEDFNWRSQFLHNYEQFLRGSKLVQRNARAFIAYDSIVLEGYPIQMNIIENSEEPNLVRFQMVMFLTNHADFSRIGVVDFPGSGQTLPDIAALNRDLASDNAIATGVDVRLAALVAGVTGSFSLSEGLRDVIQGINSVSTLVGGGFERLGQLLNGRVISLPIGIAGFVEQVGQGSVTSRDSIANILESDSVSATVKTVKLAQFGPVDPRIWRTRFSENVDEYPLREQYALAHPRALPGYIDAEANERIAARLRKAREQDAERVALETMVAGQDKVLTAIADTITFTKKGFAIGVTIDAILDDPTPVILDAFGLGGL